MSCVIPRLPLTTTGSLEEIRGARTRFRIAGGVIFFTLFIVIFTLQLL